MDPPKKQQRSDEGPSSMTSPPKKLYPMDPPKSREKLKRPDEGPSSMITPPKRLYTMDPPKSREKLKRPDKVPLSMIPSTEEMQGVPMPEFSKYEGVKPLQSGKWGAQVFVDDHCILLGTFKSEIAAARAHDSAAMKFLKDDFIRNFLLTDITIHEPLFQNHFSDEAILEMILDGSYEPRFIDFVRNILRPNYSVDSGSIALPSASNVFDGAFVREMFHKQLTSSEVGEQKMLMLPINQVIRFFQDVVVDKVEISLEFQDKMNRSWVFRCDYLHDIQSHVFTTGWNKFVNEMKLRANDIVVFYRCLDYKKCFGKSFDMIDIIRDFKSNGSIMVDESREKPTEFDEKEGKSKEMVEVKETEEQPKFKLFGSWI
ncbi:AP2/ERF and B3 domain-containing transcription factor At1g50680-like [Phalaenopsis equestris]|uniref:AP2/ERF and B3 domain-containing transcription factor At1g50680-like n=1 Tax=Phalaenopsis equestris TaxID=78828 RepID=UPI0009E3472E|nr:AP2/ERF and B3 domain-containing transcription factor At1g50680-like [Phalaenopsis equestris]